MASPIWEEDTAPPTSPYQHEVDDDVPLSFYNSFSPSSSSGGGSGRNTAGVRRSHTVTAAGSRLHRISSGNSGTSTSSTSAASASTLPTSSSESSSRPLSASTGVSRKTSVNKTSPGLNRVMEGSTSEEEQQQQQPQPIQYPSNAYLPDANEGHDDDDIDNQALYGYGNAPSSLARHSSMPVSRAFRRDPTNPGAPWQRVSSIHRHSNNAPQYNQQHASYNGVNGVEHTDSTAAETRLSGLIGSPTTSLFNHPTSPNAPTSPLNSGFVVTSRPSSVSISGSGFPSSSMSAAPGHGRSLSSHGWSSSTKSDAKNASVNNHSPTHSRHASDSVSSHTASANLHTHQQPQLGRVPSNASSTTHTSSNHASTPSPASPIDSSLLGQNNPWSPTAQERLHFRELSGTLNLATLRGSPASGSLIEHGDLASSSSASGTATSGGVNGPISPPSSRRGSLFTDPSSPRRANSLNLHGRNMRNRIEEPVPALPSALGAATSARQPQRRNTPILPPLVTSSEALYSGAIEGAGTQQGTVQQVTDNGAGQQTNVASPPLQQSHPNGNTSGAKIIRGPASAAPYVPPIGHTHASDRKSTSPEHVMHPPRQGHQPAPHVARNNGQHAGLDHLAHLRGFTTAGPGIPESSYLQEKDRVAGTNGFMNTQQQQQQQQQHGQGVPGFTSTPISANTAGSLNSAITMQFPSLNNVNPASAAAFTNNLQLQQHLLAQQTQALHEQQNQLAVALASGLHLQDRQGVNGTVNGNVPDGLQASLPTSPLQGGQVQMQMQGNNGPYTISAKIEALQKANAMLAAAMHDPNAQHHAQLQQNQLLQQGQNQYVHPLPPQIQRHASPSPGIFGSFAHGMQHHSPGPNVDLGRPGTGSGLNLQHVHQSQQRHDGISPIDIIALSAAKGYNPPVFDTRPAQARFFVIKSFTEDDVFKSIKFEIWSSTVLGNNRLDKAFADQTDKGPIYLFFSVNASGHFCGVAEMLTALDYTVTSNVWAQGDKWKGVMKLRWIYIKDIPNPALRHLKLTNTNEQKPVTSSRDTQEVPYEQGCEMLRIFVSYQSKTSLLQDFAYYQAQTATDPAQPPPSTAGPKMNNPHNGAQGSTQPPPAAFTQPGHPNPYNHTQHRSSTPHQQQQFSGQLNQAQYQYPHQQYPQQQYPQQQQPRNRQAVQAKR